MQVVNEVSTIAELSSLRAEWSQLLLRTPKANFFQSLDWLQVYWKYYGGNQGLRVIVIRDEAGVCGIVPLVVRQEVTRAGYVRFLTYPLDYWGSFYGPIGPYPLESLKLALQHVCRTPKDWDVIELRGVGATSDEARDVCRALEGAGLRAHPSRRDETSVVDLQGSWQTYLSQRSPKWRANFRRLERQFQEAGTLAYIRYRPRGAACSDGDPRWDLYDSCLSIAKASWQGRSTTGTTLSHDGVREFLRETHAAAADAGGLDLNLLVLDGVPAAFNYNYVVDGNVYGLRAGYDPRAAPQGAGNLLCGMTIRDSFERGDQFYDLGTGSLAAKRPLQTGLRPVYRCAHFPRTSLRCQLLWLKRCVDRFVANARPAGKTR